MKLTWEVESYKAIATLEVNGKEYQEVWVREDGIIHSVGKIMVDQIGEEADGNDWGIDETLVEMECMPDPTDWMDFIEDYGSDLEGALEG